MVQSSAKVLTVQPGRASPAANAFSSLSTALSQAESGTVIQLAPGTYSQESGEKFPLVVPDGVTISAGEAAQNSVLISGGGIWQAPGIGPVAVALVLAGNSQLQGITLSYPEGTGLWIQSGRSQIRNCRIVNCGQDGLRVVATAMPAVVETRFENVQEHGLRLGEQAKGEIRRCQFSQCGTGIYIGAQAAPLIVSTQLLNNQVGIEVTGQASPVLRLVQIQQNRSVGLKIRDNGKPDLGHPQNEGNNVIRHNASRDVDHEGRQLIVAVGNDLLPHRLRGRVVLGASQVPAAAAISPLRRGEGPSLSPPESPPSPLPSSLTFNDMRGHWAAIFADALARMGLIKGFTDGSFRPDVPVTRAQFAALVSGSFPQVPAVNDGVEFVDVAANFWAARAIDRAQQQGFLRGYPDGSFRPEAPMERGQAIVAIANGMRLPAAPASSLQIYRDRSQIPSYAVEAIAAATQKRLVVNYPDPARLRPLESTTRAEVAVLVYQGLVVQGRAPLIESDFIVQPVPIQSAFVDVQSHWASPFIQALVQQNWIRGFEDGSFRPDEAMTRAQYATLIVNAFDPQPRRPPQLFVDVPPGHWAAAAIEQAYRAGFLSGFPDATFAPNHGMVRVQTWVSLVSGLELSPQTAAQDPLAPFIDAPEIPAYALPATKQAIRRGLVTNPPRQPQLHPNQVASRADIAAAVYQALVAQNRLPPLDSPYIVQA